MAIHPPQHRLVIVDRRGRTEVAFAEVISRGINQTLQENQDVLTSLSANPAIRAVDKEQADVVLGQAKELRPSLAGLFLLDPNQNVVSYSGGIDPTAFATEIKTAADIALTGGESAITGKLVVPEGEVEVVAMVSPVMAQSEDGTETSGTPVGAIGSFISVDRLQRAFLPVSGESESQTSVVLLSADGIIADQETTNGSNSSPLVQGDLDEAIADSVAGKRVRVSYSDESGNQRMGVLLPVEYPGAQWAVAVTGPSPANYGPNESLVRNSLIALATAVLVIFFSWNEFLFALVLTGPATQTVPIGVSAFIGSVSVDWGGSSAAAVIAMLPMFLIGLAIQRFLVRGLSMGAVKG